MIILYIAIPELRQKTQYWTTTDKIILAMGGVPLRTFLVVVWTSLLAAYLHLAAARLLPVIVEGMTLYSYYEYS